MMITITASGGFGGFGLSNSAEVSIDNLPQALRTETCQRLSPAALRALDSTPPAGAADYIVYHIAISQAGGAPAHFDLPETALPSATLDLIDRLLADPP